MTESTQMQGGARVITLYECADSGCDDAPPITDSSGDKCSEREWAPKYDDCIGSYSKEIQFEVYMEEGQTWEWPAELKAPQRDGQYILVGYLFQDGKIVSDVSKEKFVVQTSNTEDGNTDNGNTDTSKDIKVVASQEPSVQVQNKKITGQLTLKNTGTDDMTQRDIIEMQVRQNGLNPLSFISRQKVCDPEHPNNVHKEFQLDAGEEKTITLESNKLEDGTYDVFFMTRDGCYPNNERVQPFPQSYQAPNVEVGNTDDRSLLGSKTSIIAAGLILTGVAALMVTRS